MFIASCVIHLDLPGVQSLKEKRSIIKSIVTRLPKKFNVAVAEIDDHDRWQSSVIGIVTIGNDSRYLHGLLEKAVAWVERTRPDVPILDYAIQIE